MESLLTESLAVDLCAADLELRELQVRFAELFDRAAMRLCGHGLDQDDVVFDRNLVCQSAGIRVEVSAEWLADRARLLDHVRAQLTAAGVPWDTEKIKIVELSVVVRRNCDRPRVTPAKSF